MIDTFWIPPDATLVVSSAACRKVLSTINAAAAASDPATNPRRVTILFNLVSIVILSDHVTGNPDRWFLSALAAPPTLFDVVGARGRRRRTRTGRRWGLFRIGRRA